MPDVPTLLDYAKTDQQKKIISRWGNLKPGRPLLALPSVLAERVALLRKAPMDVMKDPHSSLKAEKAQLEISLVPARSSMRS